MTAGRWAGRWARERPYASHVWPSARQNSPSRPARRDQPVQNSPCRPARRNQPVQNSPGTPQNADFDPLFARRENFIPHAGPLPVQNPPSERPWQAHPVQNSPSEPQNADFGPPFACRENFVPLPPPTRRARRKKSRTNTPPQPSNVPLSKFRTQFDCMNFQQSSETLQFQRHKFTL